MTQEEYLRAEFKRFYPNASIQVYTNDEVIRVSVADPGFTRDDYYMEIGSDDDYYVFDAASGARITIPLMPEPAAPTPHTIDELGYDAFYEDWTYLLGNDTLSTGERICSASALRIAHEFLSQQDSTTVQRVSHEWDYHDLRLARAMIAGIRAQQGITGPDADALGQEDGLYATRQMDIWIFG